MIYFEKIPSFLEDLVDELSKKQARPIPNLPVLKSLLRNHSPAEAWIPEKGVSWVFIKSRFYSILSHGFLIGTPTPSCLKKIQEILKDVCPFNLVCPEEYQSFFLKTSFKVQPRIECFHPWFSVPLSKNLPTGLRLEPLTNLNLYESNTKELILKTYGTGENFFKRGFGFLLKNNREVISESLGIFTGGNYSEICVFTKKEFRNQNFSTLASRQLIEYCKEKNINPIWSCNSENLSSLKVALKLGFVIHRHYVYLRK